jgi:SAM-dependent methyltransferase
MEVRMSSTVDDLNVQVAEEERPHINAREEIVSLLRGQIACPVISCIGELGWLGRMMRGPFDQMSFGVAVDREVFAALMTYLMSLGLVRSNETDGMRFTLSEVGEKVFARFGAFCILNSYEDYMRKLTSLLVPGEPNAGIPEQPTVNRERNVLGSGALHEKKFFRPALALIAGEAYDAIADVGCGDGQFLIGCMRQYPGAELLGVDLSPVAVHRTIRRITELAPTAKVKGYIRNGMDVAGWSRDIGVHNAHDRRSLISFWFLIHEISQRSPQVVIQFFHSLRTYCAGADVLVGEVMRIPEGRLVGNRSQSLLPELILLHELSGQGLLTWQQWETVLAQIPYFVRHEKRFDPLIGPAGSAEQPSAAVWHLRPK